LWLVSFVDGDEGEEAKNKKKDRVHVHVQIVVTFKQQQQQQQQHMLRSMEDATTAMSQCTVVSRRRKDVRGEVFTPPSIVCAILDQVPAALWADPGLRWVDPTAGRGYFLVAVFHRLMAGLVDAFPCAAERKTHIVSRMLHAVELADDNVAWMRECFGPDLFIHHGDVLGHVPAEPYDCIVGNPPFHKSNDGGGKRVLGGRSKLYERIVVHSLSLSFCSGTWMGWVVPRNLFSGAGSSGNEAYRRLTTEWQITSLNFAREIEVAFKDIQLPMCTFVATRGTPETTKGIQEATQAETEVTMADGSVFRVTLQPGRAANPVMEWTPATEDLVEEWTSLAKNEVVYCRGHVQSMYGKSNELAVPVVLSVSKRLSLARDSVRPALVGWGISKAILFSMCPRRSFVMDYAGEWAAGPNTFYVPFRSRAEGERLAAFLSSVTYATLVQSTRTMRLYMKHATLQHVRFDRVMQLDEQASDGLEQG
jgi:hypothetical protein